MCHLRKFYREKEEKRWSPETIHEQHSSLSPFFPLIGKERRTRFSRGQGCREGVRVGGEAVMLLGRMGLSGGVRGPPTCLLSHLQLNQNLNDVLVSLEKQNGSNTFTIKAQPRCVMLTILRAEGGCGEVWTRDWLLLLPDSCQVRRTLVFVAPGFGLLGWASLFREGNTHPPCVSLKPAHYLALDSFPYL